ncbi:hypothetical protein C8Q70DRAFT_645395 [Cubamyces menziesii]|nr:hypothetical protein C8Q70DRAFT_645395 [Cubamyces menziesii]
MSLTNLRELLLSRHRMRNQKVWSSPGPGYQHSPEAASSSLRARWLPYLTSLGLSTSGRERRVGRSTATYPAYPCLGP